MKTSTLRAMYLCCFKLREYLIVFLNRYPEYRDEFSYLYTVLKSLASKVDDELLVRGNLSIESDKKGE